MATDRHKILMCPPDFFTVEYVINPWMAGQEESLSLERAKEQWEELRAKLGEFADIGTHQCDRAQHGYANSHPGHC